MEARAVSWCSLTVKRLGIPDSNIILMLADDMACNPRNRFPGRLFNNVNRQLNVYGDHIEVDYRGYEVTVENFLRLLTGRHHPDVPRSQRLRTDAHSNVLVFLTGHGGEDFLKFQDQGELETHSIADAFAQMREQRRYNEILFMAETCQAASLHSQFYSPGVLAIGGSKRGQNSYSHHADPEVGISVIDQFTYYTLEFFERIDIHSRVSVAEYFAKMSSAPLSSTPEYRSDLYPRGLDEVPVTDFFGHVSAVQQLPAVYPLRTVNGDYKRRPGACRTPSGPAHDASGSPWVGMPGCVDVANHGGDACLHGQGMRDACVHGQGMRDRRDSCNAPSATDSIPAGAVTSSQGSPLGASSGSISQGQPLLDRWWSFWGQWDVPGKGEPTPPLQEPSFLVALSLFLAAFLYSLSRAPCC
eukprot:jgi/Mesvir1/20418/Mv12322-RA.2